MANGFKVFAVGEVLTAADVNDYLMEQSIGIFANSTARDAQITSPIEGQFCYLAYSNVLQFYNGSSWANFIGEGDITGVTAGTGLDGGGTSGGVTINFDPNSLSAGTVNVANDSISIIDADDSNSPKKESIADFVSGIAGTNLTASSGVLNSSAKVLQVVQGTFSTSSSTTSTSASDTCLSVAITPSATSSKILIMMLHHIKVQRNTTSVYSNGDVLILRDSTTIETSNFFTTDAGGNAASAINLSATVLDSPSTTSAITYKTQFKVANGTDSETIFICFGNKTDRLIAMEIGA